MPTVQSCDLKTIARADMVNRSVPSGPKFVSRTVQVSGRLGACVVTGMSFRGDLRLLTICLTCGIKVQRSSPRGDY